MQKPAGSRNKQNHFPEDSIHAQVEKRLMDFVEKKDKS